MLNQREVEREKKYYIEETKPFYYEGKDLETDKTVSASIFRLEVQEEIETEYKGVIVEK